MKLRNRFWKLITGYDEKEKVFFRVKFCGCIVRTINGKKEDFHYCDYHRWKNGELTKCKLKNG